MKVYEHILQGHEATEQNAKDHAQNFDFSEDEKQEHKFNFQHHTFIDTVGSINIYYNHTADYYFFTDNL